MKLSSDMLIKKHSVMDSVFCVFLKTFANKNSQYHYVFLKNISKCLHSIHANTNMHKLISYLIIIV